MTALGIDTTLDVDRIQVSFHASERYMQRRRGNATRNDAVVKLRELLRRAATQRPAIWVDSSRNPVRRYVSGGFALIVSADHSTLITVYPWQEAKKSSHGGGRRSRAGGKPRRCELELDDDWDLQ